jgi:hypothetical protein
MKTIFDSSHLHITASYMERTLVLLLPRLQLLSTATLLTDEERSRGTLQLAKLNEKLGLYDEAEKLYVLLCPWMFEASDDCNHLRVFLASKPSRMSIVYILERVEFLVAQRRKIENVGTMLNIML